ncbi:MAG TPA: photosynthetic protein synthase I [Sulfurimonas sp. UBA12504]|nr:MAG TPA: photosynthetic protein synthase I [Sulfurimonas sp. UBA12504]
MRTKKQLPLTITLFASFMLLFIFLQNILFITTTLKDSKIVVEKEIDAKFLDAIEEKNIVLFFGYVGCSDICTPLLQELSTLYTQELQDSTTVVFVNLLPAITSDQPQLFASSFHEKFKGLYLTQKELYDIDREFSLFYTPGLIDANELSHSDSIYLLTKSEGKRVLKSIYTTHPFNTNQLTQDIKNTL